MSHALQIGATYRDGFGNEVRIARRQSCEYLVVSDKHMAYWDDPDQPHYNGRYLGQENHPHHERHLILSESSD